MTETQQSRRREFAANEMTQSVRQDAYTYSLDSAVATLSLRYPLMQDEALAAAYRYRSLSSTALAVQSLALVSVPFQQLFTSFSKNNFFNLIYYINILKCDNIITCVCGAICETVFKKLVDLLQN